MLLASGPFSVLDWTEGTIVQSDSFARSSPITRHPEEPPFGSAMGLRCLRPDFLRLRRRLLLLL
jgi:hypothetical protein